MQCVSSQILLKGLQENKSIYPVLIQDVVTDSRKVTENCVFVCFSGEKADGHDFAAYAIEKKAAFVVAEKNIEGVPEEKLILVPSTLHAMVKMAANYRVQFSLTVIGITGSVGKTTTKEFCSAVFSEFGNTLKTHGNQNNEIGMPNTIFRLNSAAKYAVIEMGMSNLGEISRLSSAAKPDVGIITCIGVSHLEHLGSCDNILKAKLEICDGIKQGGVLVLNADDTYLSNAHLPTHIRPVWIGTQNKKAQISAEKIQAQKGETHFVIVDRICQKNLSAVIPTVGKHNVYNALSAYAAAVAMGLDPQCAANALNRYETTGMRQKLVYHAGVTVMEDCYNASPDSMKAAFDALCEIQAKRRCALVGDMLELGELSEQAHKQTAAIAANVGVNLLVCYGEQSRLTAQYAKKLGIEDVFFCTEKENAAEILQTHLMQGDALLVKASRGMRMEDILKMYYNNTQTGGSAV